MNDNGVMRAEVYGPNDKAVTGWGCVMQSEANARLIAAAPDLLEAVKTLLTVWENKDKEPGWVKRFGAAKEAARAAIRKAQGAR